MIETASKTYTESEAQVQSEAQEIQSEAKNNENEADVQIEAKDSETEATFQHEVEKIQETQCSEVTVKLDGDSDASLG